jgi:hypothetical protein
VDEWAHELVRRGTPIAKLPQRAGSFENFRRCVLRDSSLAKKLHETCETVAVPEAVATMGQQLGFDFTTLEIGCSANSRVDDFDRRGWVPVAARVLDGQPLAEWAYLGDCRLAEPFFEESVRKGQRNRFSRSFRFEAPLEEPQGMCEPRGFIFHMSRCGSTLVSQALAALPGVLTVSEAPPIGAMVQSGQSDWVRAMILTLGPPRHNGSHPGNDRYFVKLDAWAIHKLPVIRSAFPGVPWIFLYRDPLEVLVSHIRVPGTQCLPGALDPAILEMTFQDITALSREEWSAQVLAKLLRSAIAHRGDPLGMFVDYRDLPGAIWGGIAKHFGIEFDDRKIALMRETVQVHAKFPGLPFAADSADKRQEASPAVRALAAELLEPLYRQLSLHS